MFLVSVWLWLVILTLIFFFALPLLDIVAYTSCVLTSDCIKHFEPSLGLVSCFWVQSLVCHNSNREEEILLGNRVPPCSMSVQCSVVHAIFFFCWLVFLLHFTAPCYILKAVSGLLWFHPSAQVLSCFAILSLNEDLLSIWGWAFFFFKMLAFISTAYFILINKQSRLLSNIM